MREASDSGRFDAGLENRARMLGSEYVEKTLAEATDFESRWQRLLTEFCWGEVWGGSALSDRQRSLNNLCLLAALGREREFELHFRGALRNGCTLEELEETLIQIAVYAGIPAAVVSFGIARRVLAESE